MKNFDHNGLLLCEFQGKIFEKSAELDCSSSVFLRRFLHSNLSKALDDNTNSNLSLDAEEGLSQITNEFGDSTYGKIKYSKSSLFWIGYLYRYISYTREQSTKFVMQIFPYKQLNDVYYTFHTQDPEWCIRNLLEMNKLNEYVFDNNFRLKQVIKEKGNY